jgi:hypothetical protein
LPGSRVLEMNGHVLCYQPSTNVLKTTPDAS